MNYSELKVRADEQRITTKRLLGELLGKCGYLNESLPLSQFVDSLISTAVLEILVSQVEAIEAMNREGCKS